MALSQPRAQFRQIRAGRRCSSGVEQGFRKAKVGSSNLSSGTSSYPAV
jgi:hypothetical protein